MMKFPTKKNLPFLVPFFGFPPRNSSSQSEASITGTRAGAGRQGCGDPGCDLAPPPSFRGRRHDRVRGPHEDAFRELQGQGRGLRHERLRLRELQEHPWWRQDAAVDAPLRLRVEFPFTHSHSRSRATQKRKSNSRTTRHSLQYLNEKVADLSPRQASQGIYQVARRTTQKEIYRKTKSIACF